MNIAVPTLLLNKDICRRNIQSMYKKAKESGVTFRPHFKTHQSVTIGDWFREMGTKAITVSSVRMAKYFAVHGWEDITIAFPLNIREINEINELARQISLNILIVSSDVLPGLAGNLLSPVGVYVKIDTGNKRSGIIPDNLNEIDDLLTHLKASPNLEFKGFLTHSGHTYGAKSAGEIIDIYNDTVEKLAALKNRYEDSFGKITISVGDTPSASIAEHFTNVDEIRPGNFVFYDLMQSMLGSCSLDQVAVVLAVPVVAKYEFRNEIIVYGGAVHLSKEYIVLPSGEKSYGLAVELTESGWRTKDTGCFVSGLSQEHGILKTSREMMNKIKIGDLIGIVPVHSCLTANLMRGYLTLDGEEIEHMEKNRLTPGMMRNDM